MAYGPDKETGAEESKETPDVRKLDGSNNNKRHPEWGQADQPLLRRTKHAYVWGSGYPRNHEISGAEHLNPRRISNIVCLSQKRPPHPTLSNFMWAWGQYLDHEIDLSLEDEKEKGEHPDLIIRTPEDDPHLPGALIGFNRSRYVPCTGTDNSNPREQTNVLPAYIDAANVYGAHRERVVSLRRLDGTGKMRSTDTKKGELLPYNHMGLDNAKGPLRGERPASEFFVAGDFRVNEHNVLICMHTLFLREHNRLCGVLAKSKSPALEREIAELGRDEAIFQRARRIVGALEQVITYEEFLPALLGPGAIRRYRGYKRKVDATIANEFSTAAYRLGHDMLGDDISLVVPGESAVKKLKLHDAFFNPEQVAKRGIEPYLNGLALQNMEQINGQMTDSIRSHLFNIDIQDPSKPGGPKLMLDLAVLNIQRGRDHGLPDYNSCRRDYGLQKVKTFEEITSDQETLARLKNAYKNVDEIDPWIGGLVEDHHKKGTVGELFHAILVDQFTRLRDGDRFYYENEPKLDPPGFTSEEVAKLKKTRLSHVIKRNTKIKKIKKNVFFV